MGPHPEQSVHRARAVAALAALVVVAVLAGCGGSVVDPKTAARAQTVTGLGVAGQGADTGDSTSDPATDQGTEQNQDPGSETPIDPGSPSSPGDVPGAPDDGGGSGGGGGGGGGGNAAPPGVKPQVSCAGFKNGPGITDDTIRIGNASDISGPVPGLFTATQQATKAYVAYFNASGATICGRKLQLDNYDSRTDAAADQAAYLKGCAADFAMVGSMSAFDSGGAAAAQGCGIPDFRAIATTVQRTACKTCFAAQPAGPNAFQNAVPDFVLRRYGGKKAAMLYVNLGAAAVNGQSQAKLGGKRGMKYVSVRPVDVAEFNYGPHVQAMKSAGVETIQFVASSAQFARLALTMQQSGFTPKLYLLDPSAYNDEYTRLAGTAGKDTVVFINFTPFEEAASNPEMTLYLRWLQQVSPGTKPTFFGLFAWSSARLFVQEATRLGGRLTRSTLLSSVAKVDNWTANGLHAAQHVGSKKIADCWRFIQWSGTAWKSIDGTQYQCRGLTSD